MSSTNRGKGVYIRQEDDFYETPASCVGLLIEALGDRCKHWKSVLDPCSGRGAILDALKGLSGGRLITFGIEIDAERAQKCQQAGHKTYEVNSFHVEWPACDAIVTNPPFFAAKEFVEKAIEETSRHNCTAAFLLRLNWLGSQKRRELHRSHPAELFVMTKRPSFTPDGGTDSVEYAWFVFGAHARPGTWHLI